jgi:hypothetical protein
VTGDAAQAVPERAADARDGERAEQRPEPRGPRDVDEDPGEAARGQPVELRQPRAVGEAARQGDAVLRERALDDAQPGARAAGPELARADQLQERLGDEVVAPCVHLAEHP